MNRNDRKVLSFDLINEVVVIESHIEEVALFLSFLQILDVPIMEQVEVTVDIDDSISALGLLFVTEVGDSSRCREKPLF